MDLDEYIFERIAKYFKRREKEKHRAEVQRVVLEDIRPRLLIIARAFSGIPIEIFPAEREGGYKNNNFFLPVSMALFPTYNENLSFYFYRIIYLSVQQALQLNWQKNTIEIAAQSQSKAQETAPLVLHTLKEKYPIAFELHEALKQQLCNLHSNPKATPDYTWLYGKWMLNEPITTPPKELQNIGDKIKAALQQKPPTTIKAKAVEAIQSIAVDKKQQEDYVLTHNFEKVETAEEFDGVWRNFDGDDELEKHQDALDELNMKLTVRVDDTTHSVYQAEFIENTSIAESSEQHNNSFSIAYPEWDYAHRQYRQHFCKVFPQHQANTNSQYYKHTINTHQSVLNGLRKALTATNNKLAQQRRQPHGNEFDLDALTDLFTDVHSKKTPSDKIYLSNRKKEKDISILLMLDSSLSSDGYVAGNRVIDIEKQVAILFGEILHEFQIDFSVASFFSKTRNYLCYNTLKNFNEPWNTAKYKIGAAEPQGYTRIGGALRHAGAQLQARATRNKWLILLSDGKPNDYDKYEGKHGISDVKQALRELNEQHINSYALAIEAQARYYLPQMFGQNHYQILSSPTELLAALALLFQKIKHS